MFMKALQFSFFALVRKMVVGWVWMGMLALSTGAWATNPDFGVITFEESNFQEFRQKAVSGHRPYFITFMKTASEPCRVMEALTFSDPSLAGYVNENFLAYRVNMDVPTRGSDDLAAQYQVLFYPTVIVFDEAGNQRHRFSGLKDAQSFREELERVSLASAPAPITKAVIHDLGKSEVFTPEITANLDQDFVKADLVAMYRQQKYEAPQPQPAARIRDEGLVYEPVETETIQPAIPQPEPAPASGGPLKGYALQAGAFGLLENARNLQQTLRNDYGFPAIVWTVYTRSGAPVYKVMVGPFAEKEDAIQWKSDLAVPSADQWFVAPLNP
jgi:cell division septation protein DedD